MDIFSALAPYSELSAPAAWAFVATLARLSTFVFLLPGLGETSVPPRARLAAAASISLLLTPALLSDGFEPPSTVSGGAFMLAAEAVAGAVLGFSLRIGVYILQTVGAIAAQTMSLSQLFGPSLDAQQESPISTLLMMAGVALAVSAGLHVKAIAALIVSYEVLPVGVFPGAAYTGEWSVARTAYSFAAALSLAMPFVLLGFIYNLAIGAANRAMPQLMVAFVGAPAVTLVGLILLASTAPALLLLWGKMFDEILVSLIGGAG